MTVLALFVPSCGALRHKMVRKDRLGSVGGVTTSVPNSTAGPEHEPSDGEGGVDPHPHAHSSGHSHSHGPAIPGAPRPKKSEQEDASEEVIEVAPNVIRMQLPIWLPGLGHVNMYGLLDDRGLAVVDPGLPGPKSWKALKQRLKTAGFGVTKTV